MSWCRIGCGDGGGLGLASSRPPRTSEGTLEQKWILEGRFLQQTYQGELMGSRFSGIGYIGYDNSRKRYLSTWMDSAGTTIHTRTGSFDRDGKTLTLTGRWRMPLADGG